MSQFHVNQIATHITEQHGDDYWKDELDEVNNLSRLLAVHALSLVLGADPHDGQRLIEVTDGAEDRGIDAVAIDRNTKLIVFVQSKWRRDGSGSLALSEVLRFVDGVRSLLGMRAEAEPVHATPSTRESIHELLKTPGARLKLVTATTAANDLAPEVAAPVDSLLGQLNDLEGAEPIAAHAHFGQSRFFASLTQEPRPRVDFDAQMADWGRASEPVKVFYGRVSAADIAKWYAEHGDDLFAENIRVVIPRSDINEGILDTIRTDPERFGYYNNGITVLAEEITMGPGGALNRDVGFFRLTNASVVNGAQTVSTLGSVLGADYEGNLGAAFVLVRCIEVGQEQEDLARSITRYANTQNEVSSQDFAFLDAQQHRLARELGVLGYEYLLRSAESPKSDDRARVIDVREAAIGLACCSPQLAHAVLAKREVSRLFSSEGGVYPSLFNPNTDALRVVRSVLITRVVDAALDAVERSSDGVEAGIAVHARRTISHVIMRDLGDDFLQNPDADLEAALKNVPTKAEEHVTKLVVAFPDNSYPGNVFKNQKRTTDLLKSVELLPG